MFHFGVMGAGRIAEKFCGAFAYLKDADVIAVSSQSAERAAHFAEKNRIPLAFGSYERMLEEAKPDAVYIATTPNFHLEQIMLCIRHAVPVLCEKAMFLSEQDALTAYAAAAEQNVFLMEATWTLFLPNIRNIRCWLRQGRIGTPVLAAASVGWPAQEKDDQRFTVAVPRGGAMYHLGIYGYEILSHLLHCEADEMQACARFSPDGVTDLAETVTLRFGDCIAQIQSTTLSRMDEHLSIYGSQGRIYAPRVHWGNESVLYEFGRSEPTVFRDEVTKNGFEYEIQEVIDCVRQSRLESDVVPHSLTLACCRMFDLINRQKPQNPCASSGLPE